MKQYSVFVETDDTGFKVIAIQATAYQVGGLLSGMSIAFMDGEKIVAEFLPSKIIGICESDHAL
jgi:hypothetical protein